VQENSDVTFRLYDWDHVDAKTGKPRELQVDKALACIDLNQGAIGPVKLTEAPPGPVRRQPYFDNAHFRLWRIEGAAAFAVGAGGRPRVLVCVEGSGHIAYAGADYAMTRGAVTLLPASLGVCCFAPDGPVVLLEIAAPEHP
jgi:mannose-6-phosphate isomerase